MAREKGRDEFPMYDRILVATDGSDIAERAGRLALAIASQLDATVHVISVVEPGGEERGTTALETIETLAVEAEIETETRVIESLDAIHEAILDYAESEQIDAIVMGTRGQTGVSRFLLGSVAMQTLRDSPIPVVTVHEDTALAFDLDDILVPTDGSEAARAAAEHAIDLASRTGATLHVLHVDADDEGEAVEEIVEMATAAEISAVEPVRRTGRPHLEIVGYATEAEIDCIVMGSHGRAGLRRYLLGSVTERTVRFATVPVVAVRPVQIGTTVEYLDYGVIEAEGWSIDDSDLFEKASQASLDAEQYGTLSVEPGEYVLDAAEAAGHDWPFFCRAGGCVNCAAIVLEGDLEMERCGSLSDEEVEEDGLLLTCVATPTTDNVKLVINAKELDSLQSRVM